MAIAITKRTIKNATKCQVGTVKKLIIANIISPNTILYNNTTN